VHPFDIKTVLFAKHAQHVVLIHFPIALFIIGVFFDFLTQWKKQHLLAAAAYYNLLVAAIATVPVVILIALLIFWVGLLLYRVNERDRNRIEDREKHGW
jgi:uncharacterized membrane protein